MDTATLIQKCLKGNARSQQWLYEQYLPYVLAIVRRFGISPSEERDLVQDIFIAVFQGLDRFNPKKGDLHQWIRGLAIHKTIAFQRKLQRLRAEELLAGEQAALTTSIDLSFFEAEYLLELIAQLPVGARTVFNLYVVDGYTHEEIGKMLDISPVGSRSQLSRAKKLLREALEAQKTEGRYGII
ncbi:RNA polymerase sigma factor [Phaeodactylibacter luteus]|nr:sigma-70 family RNA polymerase sigma factor [Phaeodactylibacter luteus]